MAITNAQQYQQLVNKPANGKRPGYKGSDYGDQAKGTGAYSGGPPGNTGGGSTDRSRTTDRQDYNTAIATGKNPLGLDLSKGPPDLTPKEKEFNRLNNLSFTERFRVNSLKNLYDQKFGYKKATPGFLSVLNIMNPALNVYERSDPNLDDYGMTGKDLTDTDRIADAINNAQDTGNITQTEFENAFFGPDGPPEPPKGDDGPSDPCKGPNPPAYCFVGIRSTAPTTTDPVVDTPKGIPYRLMNKGGMTNPEDLIGGLADGNMDETGRQMYGLGKLIKKATRAVKKVVKSPIGKAALLYAGGSYLSGSGMFGGLKGTLFGQAGSRVGQPFVPFKEGLFTKLGLTKGGGSLMPTALGGITAASALAGLMTPQEEEEEQEEDRGKGLDIAGIRRNPYLAMQRSGSPYRLMAEGGNAEPVAKNVMPLLDMDGKEKDYRETGGFVDMGRMEKADDVPARLSKNEFVFTADAVRNAGEGDIDKGAEVMYNMMKNLESGGEVSEESQGLDGAKEMFQTSQRLEGVL